MTTLVVFFIISIIFVWVVLMYNIWRKQHHQSESLSEITTPLYNKSSRMIRKVWFALLRAVAVARAFMTRLATKAFFSLFPSARKAFEKRDELTGLEHGPSSYFLKSISPEKGEVVPGETKIRRKRKNV
mgnify:CR=1 FL=1